MKILLKFSIPAGLLLLLVFAVPAVSAYGSFEISGTYTDIGQKWLNDHWGENISLGDLARIAYTPENYEKIKENVDPKLLEEVWSQPYYWGDRYPPVNNPDSKIYYGEGNEYIPDPSGELYTGLITKKIVAIHSGGMVTDASGRTCNASTWTSFHQCP